MQEQDPIVIELKNKIVVLQLLPYDGNIEEGDYLRIDYANILGECLTFPVVFNRIAILKAEVDSMLRIAKFDLDVLGAQKKEYFRKALMKKTSDSKGVEKLTKPTQDEVENAVLLDKEYQDRMYAFFAIQRHADIIDGLYWSAKSKDKKLDKMSEKIRPEEFSGELLTDTINGVLIKMGPRLFA